MNQIVEDTGTRTENATPIVAARSVSKTYTLDRVTVPVLRDVSLDVYAGEWMAILGASGSGKSTLLHLLGDLDQPDDASGEILYQGAVIDSMSRRDRNRYRNRTVGFVFQFYHLLPELSVLENALLPAMVGKGRLAWGSTRRAATSRASDVLASFGLADRLRHRPSELSGGERQRVAIARALMNEPDVLLADEPTGNLDEETGGEILDLLAEQHRSGLTVVMVTHDRSIASRSDRVVELRSLRGATASR